MNNIFIFQEKEVNRLSFITATQVLDSIQLSCQAATSSCPSFKAALHTKGILTYTVTYTERDFFLHRKSSSGTNVKVFAHCTSKCFYSIAHPRSGALCEKQQVTCTGFTIYVVLFYCSLRLPHKDPCSIHSSSCLSCDPLRTQDAVLN